MANENIRGSKSLIIVFLLCMANIVFANVSDSVIENNARTEALDLLKKMDTTLSSAYWPNIQPAAFYTNVEKNVTNPNSVYQGVNTNFCGYAAFTNYMILRQPKKYVQLMLDLYRDGNARCHKAFLKPSEKIRLVAGTLKAHGKLDINPADQLLFLTLADQFKGYINLLNLHYDAGDEDNIWAATTFGKFNRMMRKMLGLHLKTRGSDLLRPGFMSRYRYISRHLKNNDVLLFVNSHFLNPSFRHFITLRVPTHYIHLYKLERKRKGYIITYWDYGLKTQQALTQKMFDKLIFGIITIKKDSE